MKKFIYVTIAMVVLILTILNIVLWADEAIYWTAPKLSLMGLCIILGFTTSLGLLRLLVRVKGDDDCIDECLWRKVEL